MAQKTLDNHQAGGLQAVRRLSHSLQRKPPLSTDPQLLQALVDIERASDADVSPRLKDLLPRLGDWVAHAAAEKLSLLVVEDDDFICQLLQKHLRSNHR